jgi:hypothetical protein
MIMVNLQKRQVFWMELGSRPPFQFADISLQAEPLAEKERQGALAPRLAQTNGPMAEPAGIRCTIRPLAA